MKLLIRFSKKREVVPDLAPMLWHSFGTIAALLQEIVSIYPAINPPNLTVRDKILYLCLLILCYLFTFALFIVKLYGIRKVKVDYFMV